MRWLVKILPLLLVAGVSSYASPEQPDWAAKAKKLVFEIVPSKSTYVLYEPVIVSYVVRNPTTENIKASVVMFPGAGRVMFWIEDSEKGKFQSGPGATICLAPGVAADIAPGDVLISETQLMWNRETAELAFQGTGSYKIHGQINVGGSRVALTSEPVEIQIVAPENYDAEAIEFFDSEEEFLHLMKEGVYGFSKQKTESDWYGRLETFLEHHSDSAYAPLVQFELAGVVASVSQELELGIGHYRTFLENWPSHPYASRAMYQLARALRDTGALQEAIETVGLFESSYPERRDSITHLRWDILGEGRQK
jgi:hypothetical protein